MIFQGFPKEGLAFLDAIILNNSKEWLNANKEEYEQYILAPNRAYVAEMGEHLQILVPHIHAIPKINKSLFRIYRDARFHLADPIKERIGIIFWQGHSHRMQSSSFYMHYAPHEIFVATGIRNFKPPMLAVYREYIQNTQRRTQLHHIVETLKAKGYSLPQPDYKRYPRGFDKDDAHVYLSLFRSMYMYTTFKPNKAFHSSKIIYKNFEIYQDMLPLQEWVYQLTLYSSSSK
ncbi:MAG: DUF2461 domain-containing protein [Sulfurovum sp.]|nr:DUF2461 domain-containing protein [Sulfurovum sp.]